MRFERLGGASKLKVARFPKVSLFLLIKDFQTSLFFIFTPSSLELEATHSKLPVVNGAQWGEFNDKPKEKSSGGAQLNTQHPFLNSLLGKSATARCLTIVPLA